MSTHALSILWQILSPRIYRSTTLCNLCACAAWLVSLCTCMHVLKVFKKQAPPNSLLSLSTSLSEPGFNNPLSSAPINKLPRGFVIHCDSFSPPLNYDNKIHEVRAYICINSPTNTDLLWCYRNNKMEFLWILKEKYAKPTKKQKCLKISVYVFLCGVYMCACTCMHLLEYKE